MQPAVIYARYSPRPEKNGATEPEPDAKEDTIETQLDFCRKYCELHNLHVVAERMDEGMTGANTDRPGLMDALELACKHRACVVVYSLSRLARHTRDAIEISDRLRECKADLASVRENLDTTTPHGRVYFTFIAALAQLEREITSERTRDAMRKAQSRGKRMSKIAPYGWEVDPKNEFLLVESPDEQDVIRQIVKWRKADKLGLRAICRKLVERGITCRGDGEAKWNHNTLQRVLRREGVE